MTNASPAADAEAAVQPLLVAPKYDERIWGGHTLASKLGKDAPRDELIGESWEIFDENRVLNGLFVGCSIAELRARMGRDLTGHVSPDSRFPVLTKLIDAHDALSVQVHPDDRFARLLEHEPNGKTECWYVIAAEPGATLTYGFVRDSSSDEYADLVRRGELEEILRPLPVVAGDVVYIPAGTVHAIGAGIVVYELQQTSDITYRIYDWNRRDAHGQSRELHVDKARQVLDYHRWARNKVQPLTRPQTGRSMLVAGDYFCMESIEAGTGGDISTHDSPVAVCALDQGVTVEAGGVSVGLARYSSLLIPAAAKRYSVTPAREGDSGRVIASYIPTSTEATQAELESQGFSAHEIDQFLQQFVPPQDLGIPPKGSLP